eukprot:8178390-Pyramimonas_sp.AAC.2
MDILDEGAPVCDHDVPLLAPPPNSASARPCCTPRASRGRSAEGEEIWAASAIARPLPPSSKTEEARDSV